MLYQKGIYDTDIISVQQTVDLILSDEIFGQLTLSEFLCFLQRFKLGRYGKIYQSQRPNPQEFLMCLRPFWNELVEFRIKAAEKEREERIAREEEQHRQEAMSYEEWQEIKMLTAMYEMKIPGRT